MRYRMGEMGESPKRPVIEVRTMEIDDLAPVFHLGEELFTAEEVPNLYRTWDEFEVVGLYTADTEYCLVAEAEQDGALVGFALGTTITKSGSAWKYGHLVWMGVDPAWQEHHVGTRLFNALRERYLEAGVRIMMVDTEADNLAAIRFFRKLGFGKPSEHLYMSLNLSNQRPGGRED
ncbi:MAG: GNAT family N-acetyltransferase [Desulfarculaceae bacterium]|nr:GNAT family N-acetyltransferase [Desulfarculaceae bacterium]MCF8072480.1 GNAT family N-acetyltransferase [Desulfarculaceae bacterium]MCF8102941.1 GNAT family N-acetyltransferase [Desulfarculaceae bacterium]MCF8117456.1 GNAT family N-acetyltransferase [Desulfarculaceae bacterium]